jgi:hypothetical protein
MADLETEFEQLIEAARARCFHSTLADSSLAWTEARRHPLNFIAFKSEDHRGRVLRLHLWNEALSFGQDGFEVHDHVFDIESFVVEGAVRQTLYEAVSDPSGAWEVFRVSYSSGGSDLTATNDRVTLRVLQEEIHREGDRYRLDEGILHRLVPATRTAVTLVLTHPHRGTPISIGPQGSAPRLSTRRSVICDAKGHPMTIASSGIANILAAACIK